MRTHYCGEVGESLIGSDVTVTGWVHRRRDHGGVIFIDLRDREGILQVVFDPDAPEMFALAEGVRSEFVLRVTGHVRRRPEGTVNPNIPSTLEAAALCKMVDRGQITGGVLDGPLAFDNAISIMAAQTKGIQSEVAGRADILVVPDLEAGNMLAKQLSFLAGAESAGIVIGARVPIVLTSRADPVRSRLASTAVMSLVAHARRRGELGIS